MGIPKCATECDPDIEVSTRNPDIEVSTPKRMQSSKIENHEIAFIYCHLSDVRAITNSILSSSHINRNTLSNLYYSVYDIGIQLRSIQQELEAIITSFVCPHNHIRYGLNIKSQS